MTTYTDTQLIAVGGREWTGNSGIRRIYLNDWAEMAGLEIERYNTGNIRYAVLAGQRLSNAAAAKLAGHKVYWADGQIHGMDDAAYIARSVGATTAGLIAALTATIDGRLADLAPATMTTREAAAQLGVSIRTIQRRAAAGTLTARRDERGRWIITL